MDWTYAVAIVFGYLAGRIHAWVMAENARDAKIKADEDDPNYYASLSEIGEDQK